jgi:hypothetical protein
MNRDRRARERDLGRLDSAAQVGRKDDRDPVVAATLTQFHR